MIATSTLTATSRLALRQASPIGSSQSQAALRLFGSPALRVASSSSSQHRALFSTTPRLPASHPKADASQSYIRGTVNDPTTYPPPNPVHGHYHWLFERALSVALLPLTAAAVAKHGGGSIVDAALGLSLIVHSHIGFDCCLQDYLHERKFPIAGKVAPWALRGFSLAAMGGLYELVTNDVGLTELIMRLWVA